MYNVYFIADPHIGHKNILKYQKNRIKFFDLKDENDIEEHDEKFINMWLNTVKRKDHVYVLGDFIMCDAFQARKILHRLKSTGCILHLIVGNHDKSVIPNKDMFESVDLIKEVTFKPSVFPFLKEAFRVVMCHYPMLSWQDKCRGSVCLHGHTHDNSPWENEGTDLRLNVGVDTPFASGGLVSLENVYEWYLKKLGGLTPEEYIEKCTNENPKFIR